MTQRDSHDRRSAPPEAAERPGDSGPSPLDLFGGRAGVQLQLLAIGALAIGGVIAILAKGNGIDGATFGIGLAGLLLLAPLPMLAGDLTDAALLSLLARRRLSVEAYGRISPVATPVAVLLVGMAFYPIVLAIGGTTLLGVAVILGAFVVFGALPIGAWLVRRLRGRSGS